ncbi:efflux RND transporter periplasmic adaptor subunit [Holophaga foetida]|uniref:efflux RND transporter periplasmic adaptor subunit n=1 Tax=Holophaga foetida TaxID=35839 RepID=UPI00130E81B2|nr:efflux RND transporter periplasmic adaptor subunit [Holophaga foetida]
MSKRTKILGGLAVLILVAAGLGLAFRSGQDSPDAYSWDAASRGDVRETINASGEIQARVKINIGTSVAGEIKALHVQDGQDVKAGDLLVTLDRVRLQQQLSQAEAAVMASRQDEARLGAVLRRQGETTQRLENLFRQGLVSDEECRQARLALESAELSYKAARANVAQNVANAAGMRDGLGKAIIRAPIAGRVTSLKAEKGETAIPGMSNLPGATLMIISDMSEINAEINVNENEVVRLRLGQAAQVMVEPFPGEVFQGRVLEIASAAEKVGQDANMYKVKVALDMGGANIPRLRPGMSTRAVILTSEAKGVLRVPLQSVMEREGSLEDAQKKGLLSPEARSVVWVVQNGRAMERNVETGAANTQFFEVKEGLQGDEKVLTGPIRKLKELKERTSVKLRKLSDTQQEQKAQKRDQ